jgi:hypothetical protein
MHDSFLEMPSSVRSGQKIGKPNISEVFESSIDKLIIEAKKKLTHELIN